MIVAKHAESTRLYLLEQSRNEATQMHKTPQGPQRQIRQPIVAQSPIDAAYMAPHPAAPAYLPSARPTPPTMAPQQVLAPQPPLFGSAIECELAWQIEWYFSDENLFGTAESHFVKQDAFLKQPDKLGPAGDGEVTIALISSFKRVRDISTQHTSLLQFGDSGERVTETRARHELVRSVMQRMQGDAWRCYHSRHGIELFTTDSTTTSEAADGSAAADIAGQTRARRQRIQSPPPPVPPPLFPEVGMAASQPFAMPMYHPPNVMLMPFQPPQTYGTYLPPQVLQPRPQLRQRPMGDNVDGQRHPGYRHINRGHGAASTKILRKLDRLMSSSPDVAGRFCASRIA